MKTDSKSGIILLLQRLSLILYAIFPLTLSIIAQAGVIINSWNVINFIKYVLLGILLLLPIFLFFAKNSFSKVIEENKIGSIIWVVGLAIVLRIILMQLLSSKFLSDMEDIHFFAVDISNNQPLKNIDNYPNIPLTTYLNMTALVTSYIYKLFGANTDTAKLLMVFLGGITTFLVYITGKEIANIKVGFISAFIFATLPSISCYTGILVGDHLASPLMVLSIFVFTRILKINKKSISAIVILCAILGILIGLSHWFRPFGIILITATIISVLIHGIKSWDFRRNFIITVVLIFTYLQTSDLAVKISEELFQANIPSPSQRIGEYFLKGLNPESKGQITIPDEILARETYMSFGDDVSGANKYLIQYSFSRLQSGEIKNLLRDKFVLIWSSHDALFDYALFRTNDHEFVNLLRNHETILFLVITFFMSYHAIKNVITLRINPAIFIMQLFILGFAIMLLVLEVQNRYIAIVIPYSILLGIAGMNDAFSNREFPSF